MLTVNFELYIEENLWGTIYNEALQELSNASVTFWCSTILNEKEQPSADVEHAYVLVRRYGRLSQLPSDIRKSTMEI